MTETANPVYRRVSWYVSHPIETLKTGLNRLKSIPLETLPDCPDLFHVYRELARHPHVTRQPGGWEYKGKFYPDYLTVGGACHAIFREALKYYKGTGIDVGAGLWPIPCAVPVDTWRGPGARTTISQIPDGSQDFALALIAWSRTWTGKVS